MPHTTVPVSLETIQNGVAIESMNEAIEAVAQDVIHRPEMLGVRKVILEVTITPDKKPGTFPMPAIGWSVGRKLPGQSGLTVRGFVEDGELRINTEADDPLQTTIDRGSHKVVKFDKK